MLTPRLLIALATAVCVAAQTLERPVQLVTDPGVVTTRQKITPAGTSTTFQGRVYGVTFGADANEVWVLHATHVYRLDWRTGKVLQSAPHEGRPGLQGIRWDGAGSRPLVSAYMAGANGSYAVRLLTTAGKAMQPLHPGRGEEVPGALAIAARANAQGQRIAVVPLIGSNELLVVDVASGKELGTVYTGVAPFGAAINADGSVAYVSNWGGRLPGPDDVTATTGLRQDADRVVVDRRGLPATGTVIRVDLRAMKPTHTIDVGLHPTAIAWDEARQRLYVTGGGRDVVTVVNTERNEVARNIELQPFHQKVAGIAPTALAVSPDGETVFVACGGINAVAVVETGTGKLRGMVPTGWYPNALSLSGDGKLLAISTLLGAGAGSNGTPERRTAQAYRGSVAVVPVSAGDALEGSSTAVAENNHMALAGSPPPPDPFAPALPSPPPRPRPRPAPVAAPEFDASAARPLTGLARPLGAEGDAPPPRPKPAPAPPPAPVRVVAPAAKPAPVPYRASDPSLIEHVVYIVKEGRTFDEVLGDLGKGNGKAALAVFGRDVTPNHHKLAEQFVVLDNFHAVGATSAEGHQWATQANATPYCAWEGYAGRSVPHDGSDPLAYSASGFLWDAAVAKRRTVKVFGEYAGSMSGVDQGERDGLVERWQQGGNFSSGWTVAAPLGPLNTILATNYPSYTLAIPDVVRARIFLAQLKRWEAEELMPNLVVIQLPSGRTFGDTPGMPSAKAMMADNDLALGQVVEALSKSRFWPKMAVFAVEAGTEGAADHVDGHRAVALIASPYVKRGHVDSTQYSTLSVLKTIELMLGLPHLTLFDLIATDLRGSFQGTPDLAPYEAETPKQPLVGVNAGK